MLDWGSFYLYISLVLSLVLAMVATMTIKALLNILQLSGYHVKPFIYWLNNEKNKNTNLLVSGFWCGLITSLVFGFLLKFVLSSNIYSVLIVAAILVILVYLQNELTKQTFKKPLVYTMRVKRLIITHLLLLTLINFLTFYLLFKKDFAFVVLALNINLLLPLTIILANYINYPIEKLVQFYYILKAKNKLKQFPNLTIIGITGSYGKTSCKFILTQILKEKYFTLCTPNSYNTPMGITKTILNDLKPHHEVFVVEMGADRKNDINRICKILKPHYAILTSIGAQHLETFKTINNIILTKNQIMQNLQPGGVGIYNCSNALVYELYKKAKNKKIDVAKEGGKYYAKDIEVSEKGTKFKVVAKGKTYELKTKLLGEHNVTNILLAIAVANELKVTTKQITKAVENLQPVKNRLELVKLAGGGLILDDSFNSNPQGAKEALKVLSFFTDYKKIVITPGMVELKNKAYEENFNFGKAIGRVADEVYIINYINKEAIYNGLRVAGFPLDKVKFYENFKDAFLEVKQNLLPNHIILIENDLPDNYI